MTSNKIIKVLDINIEHKVVDYVDDLGYGIPFNIDTNLELKLFDGEKYIFPIINYYFVKDKLLCVVLRDGLKMFVGWY